MKTLILANESQSAFPNHDYPSARENATHVSTLEVALFKRYRKDAHTTQYSTPVIARRLDNGIFCKTEAELEGRVRAEAESRATRYHRDLPTTKWVQEETKKRWEILGKIRAEGGIKMFYLMFDIDGPRDPKTHECTPEFRKRIDLGVANLFDEHPGLYYSTRGGGRVVYLLDEPRALLTRRDADVWAADYATYCRYVARWLGLPAIHKSKEGRGVYGVDLACADWGHLFRLPRACRDGKRQNPQIIGELQALDNINRDELKQVIVPVRYTSDQPPSMTEGILLEMMTAMGNLGQPKAHFHHCRCPLWWEHEDKTRDGLESSCSIFGANVPGGMGTLYCMHESHRLLKGAGDWQKACKWGDKEFALSATWRRLNSADTSDSWGTFEHLRPKD